LGLMDEQAAVVARKTFLPAARLLETKPALGFDLLQPDDDRVLRRQPMLTFYDGYYYPSLPLIAAAVFHNVSASAIRVTEAKSIDLGGKCAIPIDRHSAYFVNFPPPGSIVNYSAADILSDTFDRRQLAGKLVLIGLDDVTSRETFTTPVAANMTKLQVQAAAAENIVNADFLAVSHSTGTTLLILLAVGIVFAFLLPQVSVMYRFIILLIALVILINANYFLFSAFRVVPETVYIALELLLFLAATPLLDSQLIRGAEPAKARDEFDDIGALRNVERRTVRPEDLAHAPVRTVQENPLDHAPTTAIDYRPARTSTAPAATEALPVDHAVIDIDRPADEASAPVAEEQHFDASLISDDDLEIIEAGHPAPADRSAGAPMSETVYDPPADASGEWDLANQTPGGTPRPANLGRYQITGTLGRGAMGLVYRGIDPAINRPVALKTIRLDFVNDPEEMKELKERLYREAQAAGKLSHPNIVTIYDVGSEGPLQYIAMEYLEGRTLEEIIKKKTKFNYRIFAEIIIQVCSALQYAHEQGIVHRDIKPANLMVLRDYRVKVMDYGIARIDTSSMTKTGIAMGTPNYISPEQLKGQKSDHRADIFSLGVVMYEMLLGKRPFKGENITSLIYAIINQEPDKPSDVNPTIPLLFDHVIMKALKKDPAQRYQRAGEIAVDLKDFVESFASGV
ncbi:MAG TPA: serine/threonine-protein kinase, partial [candidate division Zixibacteria bacterium]|nr:serine/threonine-protein kinase [candidate division Zixibacteria bacterium]